MDNQNLTEKSHLNKVKVVEGGTTFELAEPKRKKKLSEYWKQILASVTISIAAMAIGFSSAYTSPALVSMDEPGSRIKLTNSQKSWVGSLMPLSALFGSILGGFLVDGIGRKGTIVLCGPGVFCAYILIGAAQNPWMIYVGRVITGLCVGLLSLCNPLYIAETIEKDIRGTMGLLPTTVGNFGILISYVIGAEVDWSTLAYIGCAIPITFFFLMLMVPETPRLHVAKEKTHRARKSLQWLRGPGTSNSEIEEELNEIKTNFELSQTHSASIKDLFQKRYLKPFGLSVGLMMFQQLSGINAVVFYTVSIFKMSGSNINEFLSTIIMGVVNLAATLVSNTFIDKFGRKALLYISSILMILSLCALSFFFYISNQTTEFWQGVVEHTNWLPLLSLVMYIVGFSLGFGPIPWLFMAEALPVKIRGKAASVVTALNWACTFIITKNFIYFLEVFGKDGTFLLFAVIMICALLFCIFFVIETKGKSLEQIEIEFGEIPLDAKPSAEDRQSPERYTYSA